MSDHTTFKSVNNLGDSLVSDLLESNLISFFDWAFLQAGGFFNVTFPAPGTRLRRVSDPDYGDWQVWEGYRKNWVWEAIPSGSPLIGGGSYSPVPVSGVWITPGGVGGTPTFSPMGSGYHVDFPQGRVVFDAPLPSGSSVALEFSFRRVAVATSDAEWFQQLQFDTLDLSSQEMAQFEEVASGAWNVLSSNRIQLPAIVVEAVTRVRHTPLQIGSRALVHEQEVLFHVLAETPYDRKQLHDVVVLQRDHRLQLFDKNAVDDADAWPLDEGGSLRAGALTYPQMVAPTGGGGYRWRTAAVTMTRSEPQTSFPPLYRATCRWNVELDIS